MKPFTFKNISFRIMDKEFYSEINNPFGRVERVFYRLLKAHIYRNY